MSNSNFLENLKNAVDSGEFNSDAAKKIVEISKLADNAKGFSEKDGEKAKELLASQAVSEEEALRINSQYEEKMKTIKKQELINKQLAIIIDIEEMIRLSISDMFIFVNELTEKFGDELNNNDPMISELQKKIDTIKSTYETFTNN